MKPVIDALAKRRKHRTKPKREAAVLVRYFTYGTDTIVEVDVKNTWDQHRHQVWLTRAQALNLARSLQRKLGACSGSSSHTQAASSQGSRSASGSSRTRSETSTRSDRRTR